MPHDEDVGYGRPPKQSRWKPGQSGNPRGRPRDGSKALLAEAGRILSEPVTATAPGGARVLLGAFEAAYLSLCRSALKGDDAALFHAFKVMLELVPAGEEKQAKRDAEHGDAKRKLWVMLGLDEADCPEEEADP